MAQRQFLEQLNLSPAADFDEAEAAFLAAVKQGVQDAGTHSDGGGDGGGDGSGSGGAAAGEDDLRQLHQDFFQYALRWVKSESARAQSKASHPDAAEIRRKAKAALLPFHNLMIDYALCYLQINHYQRLMRDEMNKEESRLAARSPEKLRWSADAGIVMGRHTKQMHALAAMNDRLTAGRPALADIEQALAQISESLAALLGKDSAILYMRRLNVALRKCEWDKFKTALADIGTAKRKMGTDQKNAARHLAQIQEQGAAALTLAQTHQDNLVDEEGRLFLKSAEADTALESNRKELAKIKDFLARYHMPYMQYKSAALDNLRDKLLVVGSLEGLMTLYKELLTGLARPMPDIATVRNYESEVLGPAQYLVQGLHDEIPKIRQRADETLQEFRDGTKEFTEAAHLSAKAAAGH